jgi:hypothetical protein
VAGNVDLHLTDLAALQPCDICMFGPAHSDYLRASEEEIHRKQTAARLQIFPSSLHYFFPCRCHQGMARPQVEDEGTASNMESNYEYIEQAVADSRQDVVLQLEGWSRC